MTTPPIDDAIRDLFRRAVAATPTAPAYTAILEESQDSELASGRPTPRPAGARRGVRTFIATLLAVLSISGGGYLAYSNLVGPDGYDSPIEAAEGFVDALASRDLLRASRALVPFEREHMDVRLRNVLSTVIASKTLRANNLSDAQHISLRADGLRWREQVVVAGVSRVSAVDGHLWLRYESELFGEAVGAGKDATVDLVDLLRPPDDDRGHPASFMVLRRNGRWYVSLSTSILDAAVGARRDEVDFHTAPTASGSASPEAAATAAYLAMYNAGGPTPELLQQLDPVSGEAFLRYLPLLSADSTPGSPGIRAPRWRVDGSGQWRVAQLTSVEFPNIFGDGEGYATVSDATCRRSSSQVSEEDDAAAMQFAYCAFMRATSVALVERSGRWFVDPIESAGRVLLNSVIGRTRSERASAAPEVVAPGIAPPVSVGPSDSLAPTPTAVGTSPANETPPTSDPQATTDPLATTTPGGD